MRIGKNTLLGALVGDVLSPDLRPCKEEALLWSKSVDQAWTWLSGQRFLERGVGDVQSAKITDVFAEGEFALDMNAVEHEIIIELARNEAGLLLERRKICVAPPVL